MPVNDLPLCTEAADLLRSTHTNDMSAAEAERFLEVLEKRMLIGLRRWAATSSAGEPLREAHLAMVNAGWGVIESHEDFESWPQMTAASALDPMLSECAGDAFVRVLREDFGVPSLTLED